MPSAAQMLSDQASAHRDFPTETLTIAEVNYDCLVLNNVGDNFLQEGGVSDAPSISVAVERSTMAAAAIPESGDLVTFRDTQRRVSSVDSDDLQAPIVITLKGDTDER